MALWTVEHIPRIYMLSYLQSFHVDMRILRCISLTGLLDMGMNINVYHVKLWTDDAHLCSSITCFNTVMIASDECSNLIVKWNNLTSRSDTVTPKRCYCNFELFWYSLFIVSTMVQDICPFEGQVCVLFHYMFLSDY